MRAKNTAAIDTRRAEQPASASPAPSQPAEPGASDADESITSYGAGERVAPNDIDAEGLVLGHCLEHGPVAGLLGKHFYADANRRCYEALAAVSARGEPVDVVAVARELNAQGRLQQAGGTPYLAMLATCQPATAYVESHAAAIRELYRRRVLIAAGQRLVSELYERLGSAEAWQRFKQICEEITEE